ncbi:MAG: hypothetical protein ACI836_001581 [Saprospiraceae bacterium]|jgi:hypothetical protein
MRAIPLSYGMVLLTKKKMSNKKAMSAMLPALTSGLDLKFFIP